MWYGREGTLSIHSIITRRREAHYGLRLGAVLSFWIAYVLTRPLGASIGDFLSQSRDDGGLGLATTAPARSSWLRFSGW